jgi:transcriptional regulator with XRE-family HTH domain
MSDKEVRQMNNIGDFIKERRLAKEWSKRALAEKAGISHSEVHRIENGERLNPSVPVLYALAEALGIPKEEVLRQAGYKADDGDVPLIEKVFPDLKTEKQQQTAQKIVDGLSRNGDLKDSDYDNLVRQVEMFLEYAKKSRDSE